MICHFDAAALEKMAPGDKVQVQAHGVGLQLADFPDIQFKSCSPALLEALNPDVSGDGKLVVPVKGVVPSVLAGAGAGLGSENGALNLQTSDPQLFAEAGLDDLRFGDLVAVADWDSRYGHGYLRGAMAIGVVCQGGSFRSGYGPGIAVIMTSKAPVIEPVVTRCEPIDQAIHADSTIRSARTLRFLLDRRLRTSCLGDRCGARLWRWHRSWAGAGWRTRLHHRHRRGRTGGRPPTRFAAMAAR